MPSTGCITYDGLPIGSGGAHALRSKDPVQVLRQLYRFLDACAVPVAPIVAHAELLSGPDIDAAAFASGFARLRGAYGEPTCAQLGDSMGHRWSIPLDDVERVLADLMAGRLPKTINAVGLQTAVVEVDCTFHLRSPGTREPLQGQGAASFENFSPTYAQRLGESRCFTRIGDRSSMNIYVCFPFAETTPAFHDAVQHLQSQLPFRMSEKHWRRWHLAKSGSTYVGRKLDLTKLVDSVH